MRAAGALGERGAGAVSLGLAGVGATAASLWAAPGVIGALGAALAIAVVAIAVLDWRTLTIPDELTLAVAALAAVDIAVESWPDVAPSALSALARAMAFGGAFLAFRLAYRRFRRREGLGLGDVKLAAASGLWLDWPQLPIMLELSALSALAFVAVAHLSGRDRINLATKLPFGSFLAPSLWICWWLQALTG